jgi:hypothetical protein
VNHGEACLQPNLKASVADLQRVVGAYDQTLTSIMPTLGMIDAPPRGGRLSRCTALI